MLLTISLIIHYSSVSIYHSFAASLSSISLIIIVIVSSRREPPQCAMFTRLLSSKRETTKNSTTRCLRNEIKLNKPTFLHRFLSHKCMSNAILQQHISIFEHFITTVYIGDFYELRTTIVVWWKIKERRNLCISGCVCILNTFTFLLLHQFLTQSVKQIERRNENYL